MKPRVNKQALVNQIKSRAEEAKRQASAPIFNIEEYCFPEQIKFIKDPAKYKTAVCSRRAGKSIACAADLINTCLENDNINCLYITLSRKSAKNIIWNNLLEILDTYEITYQVNNTDLIIKFKNKSTIYISGAKDESEIKKFLGLALFKVYIDEAQAFRPYIKSLIDDVISPALIDYNGYLILIGTPGPVPVGAFYESSHSSEWSNHKWTMKENPWIEKKSKKSFDEILADELKRRGVDAQDPSVRREIFGEWAHDEQSLVYKYSDHINHFEFAEIENGNYDYVFGVDIGYEDSDAIAVLKYSHDTGKCYLVYEDLKRHQTISELAARVKELEALYKPVKMVMDAGALGKKIQHELLVRFGLNLEAADKNRKFEFIELLNNDLRTGNLFARKDSQFAEDCKLVQWDRSNPQKPKISDRYHSDINDAVLYSWRLCKHYFVTQKTNNPSPDDPNYSKWLEQDFIKKLTEKQEKDWWEQYDT